MPAFGTILAPVRSSVPMEVNSPAGFMTEPPGDLWWVGLHSWWQIPIPSSVTKAESVLVNPVVRMPWVVTDPAGSQSRPGEPGYPAWLSDPMLLNGSSGGANLGRFAMLERIDRFDFWAWWLKDAMRYGYGVFTFIPTADGSPLAGTLHLHPPTSLFQGEDGWAFDYHDGSVRPVVDVNLDEHLAHHESPGPVRWAEIEGTGQRVVLLRHSIPGGVFGRHRAEMKLANRTLTYAAEALDTATPSGVLTTDQPINQPQSDDIRSRWEERQTRRRIAVLGNGAKYQQVVMTPADAEIVGLQNASDKQVAHMYELSSWELDAPSGDSMTYANIGEKRQDRVDGPLASWSARVEEVLSSLLPWGWRIAIDFSEYTKTTTKEAASDGAIDTA
jgi:Phage portal protein